MTARYPNPEAFEDVCEQLESSACLLEVLAEGAEARGDTAEWSLASVMAMNARAALSRARNEKEMGR